MHIRSRFERDKFDKTVIACRRKNMRVRTIFNRLRKYQLTNDFTGISLLNAIINTLREYEQPYSRHEVYTVFKLITRDECPHKKEVLNGLLEGASSSSVFTQPIAT